MLKINYITYMSSLNILVGDSHIKDVNTFLRFLAEVRKFNNEIILYPRQVYYQDRKAWKGLLK